QHAPQGVYPCAGDDAWIAITVASDDEWSALVAEIGDDSLRDAALASVAVRFERHDDLDKVIAAWTAEQDKFELTHRLQRAGVTACVAAPLRRRLASLAQSSRRRAAPLLAAPLRRRLASLAQWSTPAGRRRTAAAPRL